MDNNKINVTFKNNESLETNLERLRNYFKTNKKKLASVVVALTIAVTGLTGCGSSSSTDEENITEETKTENFYSDWTAEEIDELAEERADDFKMDKEIYRDVIAFLDGEEMNKQYAESDFMERGYYTADYNTGLDNMTEASIDVMDDSFNDDNINDRTKWIKRSDEFEKGSYENQFLKMFENKIDNVLADPTNKNTVEDLFLFMVAAWSEEDSELEVGDITANQVLRNDAGCHTIAIDYVYTAAYPLVSQAVQQGLISDNMNVKNPTGQLVLENANPIDFIEQEVIGPENICFNKDDKLPDDEYIEEGDPLNQLMRIQEDYSKIIAATSNINDMQRVRG